MGRDLDAQVDPRFGRAAYILIVDTVDNGFDVLDNSENINAFKGAGIQAAAMVSKKGAEVLLTGYCGPNAYKTLQAAGVKVANDVSGTVKEAVEALIEGNVKFADSANVDAHW
jgi:predicted Fe-Mo cluster-binding NifX family protein